MAKSKTSLIKKIALLLFSILILSAAAELFLRLSYPAYSNYNTEMWRYSSKLKRIDTLSGCHVHVPNGSGIFYNARIQTNSLGLRADADYITPKPKGKKRILVLGDSITMGWGVNSNYTYPKVLERLLRERYKDIEVINSGVGNYNSYCDED